MSLLLVVRRSSACFRSEISLSFSAHFSWLSLRSTRVFSTSPLVLLQSNQLLCMCLREVSSDTYRLSIDLFALPLPEEDTTDLKALPVARAESATFSLVVLPASTNSTSSRSDSTAAGSDFFPSSLSSSADLSCRRRMRADRSSRPLRSSDEPLSPSPVDLERRLDLDEGLWCG